MSAALLLRGVSSSAGLSGWNRPWAVDYRACLESHRKHLIEPLKALHGVVDVYLSTYETPQLSSLVKDYDPAGIRLPDFAGSSQRRTALAGLRLLRDGRHDYDLVVVSRFDAEYLSSPIDLDYEDGYVNFIWRELTDGWANHRRTGDCVHVVGGSALGGFVTGIEDCPHENCMHFLWDHVVKFAPAKWLLDHFGDSNTDIIKNSVYRLCRIR